MDYKNAILAELREGRSVDDIASELTKCINEANREYNDELEADKKREAAKKKIISDIADNMVQLLSLCGVDTPDCPIEQIVDQMAKDINEFTKTYAGAVKGLSELKFEKKEAKDTEDPIEDFLNKYIR